MTATLKPGKQHNARAVAGLEIAGWVVGWNGTRTLSEGAVMSSEHQVLNQLALGLKLLAGLRSVYVAPLEDMAFWTGEDAHGQSQGFGHWLGTKAAAYLGSELLKHIQQNSTEWLTDGESIQYRVDASQRFHIGIAGGTTIHGLVQSFQFAPAPASTMSAGCLVTPLALLPIPEPAYSAEVMANELARRMREGTKQTCEITEISDRKFEQGTFKMSLLCRFKCLQNDFKQDSTNGSDRAEKTIPNFNWIITGVGSPASAQLKSHWRLVYGEKPVPEEIIGDIGSRLLQLGQVTRTQSGSKYARLDEYEESKSNDFVLISLGWLRYLAATRSRVIVIAGGRDKVRPLYNILRSGVVDEKTKLLNTLITDEFTARSLLTCFGMVHGKVPI